MRHAWAAWGAERVRLQVCIGMSLAMYAAMCVDIYIDICVDMERVWLQRRQEDYLIAARLCMRQNSRVMRRHFAGWRLVQYGHLCNMATCAG